MICIASGLVLMDIELCFKGEIVYTTGLCSYTNKQLNYYYLQSVNIDAIIIDQHTVK